MTVLDSPVLTGIIAPILTVVAMAFLRYVQKEITGAIESTKQSVLKEVQAVDKKVGGVMAEQAIVREELKKHQDSAHAFDVRLARLEGRRDAQLEQAHLASAAAVAVDVITHKESLP